jgi:hypothetical protein
MAVGEMVVDVKVGPALREIAEMRRRLDAMLDKIGEQLLDINFLAARAAKAGFDVYGDHVDCGPASNSIVAIAYGHVPVESQDLPQDLSELHECQRMLEKLPLHRISKDVHAAMFRATEAVQHVGGRR